jgi:hypothetical protein
MKKTKRYDGTDGSVVDGKDYGGSSGTGEYGPEDIESKGEGMLKAMRDEASKPKPKAKPAMPKLEMNTPSSKPRSTQTGASVPTIGASGTYGGGLGRRSHPEYPEDASRAMADMKKTSTPDVTKMSLAERMKESREKSRSGSGKTDTRSVNERFRSALGFAKGGSVSASSRADGIAQRGKTRGKMC